MVGYPNERAQCSYASPSLYFNFLKVSKKIFKKHSEFIISNQLYVQMMHCNLGIVIFSLREPFQHAVSDLFCGKKMHCIGDNVSFSPHVQFQHVASSRFFLKTMHCKLDTEFSAPREQFQCVVSNLYSC